MMRSKKSPNPHPIQHLPPIKFPATIRLPVSRLHSLPLFWWQARLLLCSLRRKSNCSTKYPLRDPSVGTRYFFHTFVCFWNYDSPIYIFHKKAAAPIWCCRFFVYTPPFVCNVLENFYIATILRRAAFGRLHRVLTTFQIIARRRNASVRIAPNQGFCYFIMTSYFRIHASVCRKYAYI